MYIYCIYCLLYEISSSVKMTIVCGPDPLNWILPGPGSSCDVCKWEGMPAQWVPEDGTRVHISVFLSNSTENSPVLFPKRFFFLIIADGFFQSTWVHNQRCQCQVQQPRCPAVPGEDKDSGHTSYQTPRHWGTADKLFKLPNFCKGSLLYPFTHTFLSLT